VGVRVAVSDAVDVAVGVGLEPLEVAELLRVAVCEGNVCGSQ